MAAANLKVLDETFKRLSGVPGVLGVMVCTTDGIPVRTTFEKQVALQYAALTLNVSQVARRTVKQLSHATYGSEAAQQEDQKKADDGGQPNELQHVRLRTAKHEIMIVVPEDQLDYFMVVVHATDTKAA